MSPSSQSHCDGATDTCPATADYDRSLRRAAFAALTRLFHSCLRRQLPVRSTMLVSYNAPFAGTRNAPFAGTRTAARRGSVIGTPAEGRASPAAGRALDLELRFGWGEPDRPVKINCEVVRVGDHDQGAGRASIGPSSPEQAVPAAVLRDELLPNDVEAGLREPAAIGHRVGVAPPH